MQVANHQKLSNSSDSWITFFILNLLKAIKYHFLENISLEQKSLVIVVACSDPETDLSEWLPKKETQSLIK